MSGGERILVMSHGHPDLIRGGGEIAAYELYRAYLAHPDTASAFFLARADLGNGATGRIARHAPGEYLWEQGLGRAFRMQAANLDEVTGHFAELVRALRPTVVHAHHFFMLGLEYLKVVKGIDPSIRLVLTLHEYLAICPNSGLMMKPGTFELCRSGHYADHLDCHPEATADDLWLRKHRFERYFDHVDHFVAPSEYLRDRYLEWGLAPERISVLRNGQRDRPPLPPRPLAEGEGRSRFGFFGQISEHKGIAVLLEALRRLPPDDRCSLSLEVHGANLEFQPAAFRRRLGELAAPLLDEGTLIWAGPYRPEELPERMAGIDWVTVPSIWVENAPLVIQEAFMLGRPVLATRLGGMAEAVEDGITGCLLPRLRPDLWARAMHDCARAPELWDRLRSALPRPPSHADAAADHMALFARIEPVAA